MKKQFLLGVGLVLAVGFGTAFAVPASRYRLLALIRDEPLYNGRPLAYWMTALEDADPAARRQAALTLGDAEVFKGRPADDPTSRAVTGALARALGDRDGFVRKCAATSLLRFPREWTVPGDGPIVTALSGALPDKEVAVRKAATRALWQTGAAAKQGEGVARLTEALRDDNDFVRMFAARALARLGADARPAVPALIRSVRDDDESDVRKLAGKALGLIGPETVGPLLPEATAALTKALKEKGRGNREYAARALGELHARAAIPALRQIAAQDKDEGVRAAAAASLKQLESPVVQKDR